MASTSNSWINGFDKSVLLNNKTSQYLSESWGGSAAAKSTASYASGIFGTTGYTATSDVSFYSKAYDVAGRDALKDLGVSFESEFPDLTDTFSSISPTDTGWTFIVAPEDINWSVNAKVDRIEMYGTNAPPVISGTKGMRDLTLGNALVEGFSRLRTIEDKVIALENLQNFSINSERGFVNTPVYQIWANNKKYGYGNGIDGGFFVIESISVKETMRDLDGNATRAFVDLKLVQVPSYQVDSGRDQASQAQAGVKSSLISVSDQVNQKVKGTTEAAKSGSGASSASPSGSGSTSSKSRSQSSTPLTPRNPTIDDPIIKRTSP